MAHVREFGCMTNEGGGLGDGGGGDGDGEPKPMKPRSASMLGCFCGGQAQLPAPYQVSALKSKR